MLSPSLSFKYRKEVRNDGYNLYAGENGSGKA